MKEVFLVMDMGGTQIKIALIHGNGKIIQVKSLNSRAEMTMENRLEALVPDINELISTDYNLKGIGIAFPGIIDFDKGQILSKYVKYPQAHITDIPGWAKKHWDVPLLIENDARAALVGEWQHGSGKNCDNLVMVTLGTGMGSAVLINAELLRGKNYLAGNLGGHMSIDFEGDFCNCGNKGCVETAGSTWALKRNLEKIPNYKSSSLAQGETLNFLEVFTKASQGDEVAEKLKLKSLEAWAAAIINLLHAFDPEKLILGGGVMQSKEEIIPFLEKRVGERSWLSEAGVEIVAAEQSKYAGLLWVVLLARETYSLNGDFE
ncbi:ROK family protein [Antarcticibacterium sp. 1MA-6-2]|uniref:ROK family protein n=1 Tax=Antarcticibacterium sp. 1MA-6-2 TaxID=2908210 RepID=UPI001F3D6960|nr:ROK family protein [Antarcticibacterium sp. 1MA-6-2]UJH90628.1 ROK family protein [Antarcticibacterium sp. 1MA-6-2]